MPTMPRLTLYLRQRPEEQELYQFFMRKSPSERTALHRAMLLAEYHRRKKQTKKRSTPERKPAPRQGARPAQAPPTTGPAASWNQRIHI